MRISDWSSDVCSSDLFKWDVSDFAACQAWVARIEAEVGPIDILVNNAGITRDGTIHKMDHDMWQAVIDTNLGSCFNMCRCTIEGMRARKFGRVVNIGRSEEHTSELQSLMRNSYAV